MKSSHLKKKMQIHFQSKNQDLKALKFSALELPFKNIYSHF